MALVSVSYVGQWAQSVNSADFYLTGVQNVARGSHISADCFERTEPTVVPAQTFLSQLL